MLWESLQKPACSPGICDDMQAFFFFLCGGYGSVCVLGGGGRLLVSVSMTTMSLLIGY